MSLEDIFKQLNMKVGLVAAALVAADGRIRTPNFTPTDVYCNGHNQIIIKFDFANDIPSRFEAGTCTNLWERDHFTQTNHGTSRQTNEKVTVSWNPYDCQNDIRDYTNMASYNVDQSIGFEVGYMLGSHYVQVGRYQSNVKCTFENSYRLTKSFGETEAAETPIPLGTMDLTQSFKIQFYTQDDYATVADVESGDFQVTAADTVYLKFVADSVAAYEPAVAQPHFDSEFLDYAPIRCRIGMDGATTADNALFPVRR